MHDPVPLKSIAIRVVVCAVVVYAAWVYRAAEGLVYSSGILGMAFARPILDAIIGAYNSLRRLAYRDVEGRQFSYRGTLIDIAEDEEHGRWLRLADVRKVVPGFPRDDTLRRTLGPGVKTFDAEKALRILDEALLAYLGKTTSLESAKFKAWVEKSVVYPSRRAREFAGASDRPT